MNPLSKIFNDLVTLGFEYFGRYYSSYRGFVADNQDPENFGRVKLKVPQVYGTQTMNYWAWQKGCYAGNGYGMQCIPNKGDVVYVEFEFGDPRKPIWTYGYFGRTTDDTKEKPEELQDIKNFWFKTPGGNIVEFDDTNKLVRVKNIKGFYIEINETGISLVADKVSLIKLDGAAEPAILGDKNEDTLKAIQEALEDIRDNLKDTATQDTTGVALLLSSYGVTLNYATLAAAAAVKLTTKISDIQTKISKIKSSKVTLS